MISDKEIMALLAIAGLLISLMPYYYSIYRGKTKPHCFSWLIWGTLTAIGFAAQYQAGAGYGAWVTGLASLLCFGIALLAFFKGERDITISDWVTFIASLCAIPCWYITRDPLSAIILISIIDTLAYFPTFRKSWHKPHEELVFTHFAGAVKSIFAVAAMETLSVTTWLYPVVIAVANMTLVAALIIRRRYI